MLSGLLVAVLAAAAGAAAAPRGGAAEAGAAGGVGAGTGAARPSTGGPGGPWSAGSISSSGTAVAGRVPTTACAQTRCCVVGTGARAGAGGLGADGTGRPSICGSLIMLQE